MLTIAQNTPSQDWLTKTVEDILEPDLPILDPHHHFSEHWGGYLAEDLLGDLGTGHNVQATVYVQCGWGQRTGDSEHLNPVGETESVLSAIEAVAHVQQRVRIAAGIVGYADLRAESLVEEVLDAHIAAGRGRFRGIRCPAVRHEVFRHGILPRPPEGLLRDDAFRRGFARLHPRGLNFDAWVYHTQLDDVHSLARAFPETTIVLNHIGGLLAVGPYAGRGDQARIEWRTGLKKLVSCPNVLVKLGGMGIAIYGYDYVQRLAPPSSAELARAWSPDFLTCIELFGADRCMFESNYPVDRSTASYPVLWNAFKRIASGASATEKESLFSATAARAYRI